MADERGKKPWQFSLKRALGAMTIVCVTLAVSRVIVTVGFLSDPSDDFSIIMGWMMVPLMGFGSAVGVLVGGKKGVLAGALVGQIVAGVLVIIAVYLGFIKVN